VVKKRPKRPKRFTANLHSSRQSLPAGLPKALEDLEESLDRPVWMCLQGGDDPAATLGPLVRNLFLEARAELEADGEPIALVIESPGGYAKDAFAIARILCRHAGGFSAVVPSYAKSAATLLTLGAEEILMGPDAELGPLDAQQWDNVREERTSALDEIQALERLHSALEQLDQTMMVMMSGTQKRTEVMLPIACRFVSDMMKPLLEKIDTVHYAKQSRVLKVAEDYATRLLQPHHGEAASEIANQLVNGYPEHGFVIGPEEMESLMRMSLEPPEEAKKPIQRIEEILLSQPPFVAIGRLKEVQ
jgi:hypothetical protein